MLNQSGEEAMLSALIVSFSQDIEALNGTWLDDSMFGLYAPNY